MKREFLKGLGLDDETINTIMAEYGKSTEGYKTEIAALQKDVEGKEAIIKNNSAEFDNRIQAEVKKINDSIKIDNAVKDKFKDVNPLLSNLLMGQIDKSKISIDSEGKIVGLDEQYTTLSTVYKDLLTPTSGGNNENGAHNSGAGGIPTGGSPNNGNSLENLDYDAYVKARKKEEKGED